MAHLVVACGGVVDESLAIISTKMAWIFLGGQREGATAAKVPPTHHTRVTVQAGPRGTTCTENTYTSAKKA